jgi:HEPN domain-containing protein
MATPREGRNTIEYLLRRGRLERIDGSTAGEAAETIIGRATRRLLTADGGLTVGDVEGAFAAAYDAYRMAAEALLIRQGLRATGGEGSHVTVEDAISGQFAKQIPGFAKPTFERLRRTRHAAQYFDPSSAEISQDDATWGLTTSRKVVEAVEQLLAADPPGLFS